MLEISDNLAGIGAVELMIQQPNCEGEDLGSVNITNVSGGLSPYTYAIDGDVFVTASSFSNLAIGKIIL